MHFSIHRLVCSVCFHPVHHDFQNEHQQGSSSQFVFPSSFPSSALVQPSLFTTCTVNHICHLLFCKASRLCLMSINMSSEYFFAQPTSILVVTWHFLASTFTKFFWYLLVFSCCLQELLFTFMRVFDLSKIKIKVVLFMSSHCLKV